MTSPLSWLVGKWVSVEAHGEYPTIKKFSYKEELTFAETGNPCLLDYRQDTWSADGKMAMHKERGFLKLVKPADSTQEAFNVAFIIAQNTATCDVEEGQYKADASQTQHELSVESAHVARASFNKEPAVKKIRRSFRVDSAQPDRLEQVVSMATSTHPELTQHLVATYKRS